MFLKKVYESEFWIQFKKGIRKWTKMCGSKIRVERALKAVERGGELKIMWRGGVVYKDEWRNKPLVGGGV